MILKAKIRKGAGKKAARETRRAGLVPAVAYHHGEATISLEVDKRELKKALHTKAGMNVLITLQIEDGKKANEKTVIIKEIQHHPLKDGIVHIDFQEISLTETIEVNVALVAKGIPAGVTQDGGVLEHLLWELRVECLPTNIPAKIDVDVTALKVGGKIHVSELVIPAGVTPLNEPDIVVMAVEMPTVEEEKPEGEEDAADASGPEVIGEKERAEKAAAKDVEKAAKAAEKKAAGEEK